MASAHKELTYKVDEFLRTVAGVHPRDTLSPERWFMASKLVDLIESDIKTYVVEHLATRYRERLERALEGF